VRAWAPWIVLALLSASAALAQPRAAKSSAPLLSAAPPPPILSAPPPPPPVSSAPAATSGSGAPLAFPGPETCREHVPAGKERPKLKDELPSRGQSGHVLTLSLVVEHGKGETVLPGGFQLQTEDPTFRALERVGLYVPNPDGGAGPALERTEQGERATTRVQISFVPLPEKPGRNTILVPPLPVSIARASGDVLVLCTQAHEVTIEDPIANTSSPMPRPNPPARPQIEEWTALKNALIIGSAALVLGALVAWLIGRWMKRPKPLPPPPPPRPPWEVALEELFDVRHAGLVAEGRLAEHFDRVSDTVRKYLGARYGFDGLESTTRECLGVLREVSPRIVPLEAIETFLRQADLVKFAKTVPSADDGELALVRAEHIVRETLPTVVPAAAAPSPAGTAPATAIAPSLAGAPPAAAPLPAGTPPAAAPSLEGAAAPTAAPAPAPVAPPPVDTEALEWGPKPPAPESKS
jgi:hypothetical protein